MEDKIFLCVIKSIRNIDDYTKQFIYFVDNNIKPKYKYHLIFKNEIYNLSLYLEKYKGQNITILWDKDIIKEEYQIVENSTNNIENVIVFEKETDIFYNVDKEDITENFAIFNNLKVLYLKETNVKKDFEIIYKDYKFKGL